ncbi:MAG: four-carbon acid sugar kinase family protein, partial [Prevotella sp.]|nr:four-carbon acid sugar kinase family protein [Prevotella sp.]
IAHRYGLKSTLHIDAMPENMRDDDADVAVIATDARSYNADAAAEITANAVCSAYHSVGSLGTKNVLFRKTDSALRGNVEEELAAIIAHSPYEQAVYMPANPSKGRIIHNGIYYIKENAQIASAGNGENEHWGTPIAETGFRFDPEFPALTSVVSERFPSLYCPDAVSANDVFRVVYNSFNASRATLLAGAADLFAALLQYVYPSTAPHSEPFKGIAADARQLIVRGSTLSKNIPLGISTEAMPDNVFYEREMPEEWAGSIMQAWTESKRGMILTIGEKEIRKGKNAAVYLRTAMAKVCCALIDASLPDELIVEGGATAFAIMQRMPWRSFSVTDEIAPGVVRIMPVENSRIHITLKPGSYEWGKLWS